MNEKKDFISLMKDHKLEKGTSTVKNPKSNGVIERVERVHGTIKSMLRSFNVKQSQLDPSDHFGETIA